MKQKNITIAAATIGIMIFSNSGAAYKNAAPREALRKRIIKTANKYIGSRYHYGDTGGSGFDCSGFVQFVYKQNGIILSRTTRGQFEQGIKIDLAHAKPGDLVFYKINYRKISHVGIYLNKSEFIHAPRTGKRVSIARMNLSYWKKRFAGAVRYIK